MKARAHIIVKGIVQGVGFRYFAYRHALMFQLKGWVANLPNGNVEVEVEGEKSNLHAYIKELRIGPRFANVHDVIVTWKEYQDQFNSFDIGY